MKLTAALLTFVTALSAHASSQSKNFPSPIAMVGHTNFYSIPDFEETQHTVRTAIDLLRDRERTSSGDYAVPLHPIARIENGHVKISPDFPDKKALSKGALIYMAQSRACDQSMNGSCLVFWKEKGLGGAILVSTVTDQDGVTHVLQGVYSSRGYGQASNTNLAKQLRERIDAKYAIFTYYKPY